MTKKTEIEKMVDDAFKQHGIKSENDNYSGAYDRTLTEKHNVIVTDQGVKLTVGSRSIKVIGSKPSKKYITDLEKKELESFGLISPPKENPGYPIEVFVLVKD